MSASKAVIISGLWWGWSHIAWWWWRGLLRNYAYIYPESGSKMAGSLAGLGKGLCSSNMNKTPKLTDKWFIIVAWGFECQPWLFTWHLPMQLYWHLTLLFRPYPGYIDFPCVQTLPMQTMWLYIDCGTLTFDITARKAEVIVGMQS